MEDRETPFDAGMRQGLAGEAGTKSPYKLHSREWVRWWSGYLAGKDERERMQKMGAQAATVQAVLIAEVA